MTSLQETHYPEASPTALRILAIDDEIEALDRIRPKSWILIYGSAVLVLALMLGMVGLMIADGLPGRSFIKGLALFMMTILGVPGAVLGLQLTNNYRKQRRLERELDELIAEPISLPPAPPS
jgi:hypothetical protein